MARRISVQILGDSSSLEKAFSRSQHSAQRFSIGIGTIAKSFLVFEALTAAIHGVEKTLAAGTSEFADQQRVIAQTAAALKSTGNAAGVTAKGVQSLALQLSNLSGINDEVIASGENVLLSFRQIRNQVGKGNDIFNQATRAVVDYAARTGKDVPQAALILGRALADPASKLAALSRAGIVFTKEQLNQVKAIEKTQGVMAAQKVVLQELAARFAGAAKAAGSTLPGELNVLRERFKDFAATIVGTFAPSFRKVIEQLTGFVRRISEAKGLHAKLAIAWEGVQAVAQDVVGLIADAFRALTVNLDGKLAVVWSGIQQTTAGAVGALRQAVAAVDWKKVWAGARGIADGLQAKIENTDWRKVGSTIGNAISGALSKGIFAVRDIGARLSKAFEAVDWAKVGGAMGPGLVTAVGSAFGALFDPGFWAKNWKLALAVAINVATLLFPEFFAPARLGKLIAAPFAKVGADAALALAGSIERFSPKVAAIVLSAMLKVPRVVKFALAPLGRLVESAFGRLGRFSQFVVRVLGIQAVIDAVAGLVQRVAGLFGGLKGITNIVVHVLGIAPAVSAISTLIRTVAGLITGGLDKAWDAMKRGAIHAVLAIIEPFTHLPGFLGGGPFRKMKDALQAQLDGMQTASVTTGKAIATSFGDAAKAVEGLFAQIGAAAPKPAGSINRSAGFGGATEPGTSRVNVTTPGTTLTGISGTTHAAAQTFVLPFRLQLEQAKAEASGSQAAILKAARDIAVFVRGVIPKLKGDKLLGAYQELAQVTGTIAGTIKEAADKAQTFTVPLALQVQQAKLEALGKPIESVLKKIKAAAEKALKSGKLGLQGQLDAWNTIAGVNDQLKNAATSAASAFKKANTKALVEGIGLSADQVKALRARLSQLGPGGAIPANGVGAFGVVQLAGAGGDTVIHTHINLDGREVATNVTRHQQKRKQRNPSQRRGPFAGGGL